MRLKQRFGRVSLCTFICYSIATLLVLNSLQSLLANSEPDNGDAGAGAVYESPILIAGARHQLYTNSTLIGTGAIVVKKKKAESYVVRKPFPGVQEYAAYTAARLGLRPLAGVISLKRENAGRVINNVTAYRYPITIDPCSNQSSPTGLFVAIVSSVTNFNHRDRLRRTWLAQLKEMADIDVVGYAFYLGKAPTKMRRAHLVQARIERESRVHGDVVLIDMVDKYSDLTVKSVGLFNWVYSNCRGASFVLKVDDDVYVNLRNLATVVKSLSPPVRPAVYGLKRSTAFTRNPAAKNYVTYEEWPWSTVPTYLSGSAVLINGPAVGSLLAAAQIMPYFYIEDVFVYGLCAREADVSVHVSEKFLNTAVTYPLGSCEAREHVTWLANTDDDAKASQIAVDQFYSGTAPCRLTKMYRSGNLTQKVLTLVYPDESVDFDFQLVDS